MDEKRTEPRWQINKAAGLTVDGGARPIPCRVEDISTRGACISVSKDLFPEVFSDFSLSLSDNFALNLSAQVAWQNQRENRNIFGLTFNQADESLKSKIYEYVRSSFPEIMRKQWWAGM